MAKASNLLHPAARPGRVLLAIAFLAFAVLGLLPLGIMFERLSQDAAVLGKLLDERTIELLKRTAYLGLGSAGIALLLGVPFGFLVARTDVLWAGALRALGIVPILIPPIMLAMTWTMVMDLRGPVMCALILGLSTFPLVSMFTARAAERIDGRREEAALMVGGIGAALRMELPLVAPSALAGAVLSFVVSVNEFSLPDYVSAVGRKFNVYAGQIFSTWQVDNDEALAVATSLPLIGLSLVALIPLLILKRRTRSGTIDGRFVRPERLKLGKWRAPATLFCLLVVSVTSMVPIGRLAYEAGGGPRVFSGVSIRRQAWRAGGGAAQNTTVPGTTQATDAATNPDARKGAVTASQAAALKAAGLEVPAAPPVTTTSPQAVARRRASNENAPEAQAALEANASDDLSDAGGGIPIFLTNLRASFARAFELSRASLISSLLYALMAATLCLPIGLVLGHAVQRSRIGGVLEVVTLLPLIVPATLFGIGTLVAWNREWTAMIYEGGGLVALLFTGRFAAIAVLVCAGAVASYDPRLEESASLAGTGPTRRLFGIVAPGIWRSLVGSWIAIFALSVRELDAAVLVPAANDTAMFRVFNAVHFGRDDFVSALALLVIFAILAPGLLWSLFMRAKLTFLP